MRRHLIHALAAAVVVCSCARDEVAESGEKAPFRTRIDTVAGIVRVLNTGVPDRWEARLLLELGEAGGLGEGGPEEFGRINALTLDGAGRLLVADAQAREIRVFDRTGAFVASWGRAGEGPGEFGSPYSLAWLGDTLAVLDPRVGRIGLFDGNGAWIGQQPYPGGISGPTSWIRLHPTGRSELYVMSLRRGGSGPERVWAKHTPAGGGESLPWVEANRGAASTVRCPTPDDAIHFFPIPFAPRLVQVPAPEDRVAVAWTEEYRVAFLSPPGDTVRVVERSHVAVPVAEGEWEEALEEYREFRRAWPGVRCSPEMPGRPSVKPAIANLNHDREGRLWVEAITAEGNRLDVYDGQGRLVAELAAPPYEESVVPYLSSERLAVAVVDGLGVQRVRVFRVEAGRYSMASLVPMEWAARCIRRRPSSCRSRSRSCTCAATEIRLSGQGERSEPRWS